MNSPLVSVIVVAFRDREEVAAIIENVAPFRSTDVELVIIDGGSDDGTSELLEANRARVDTFLSEPDKGIYDAMNKGVLAARGIYFLHINAGDRLTALPLDELRAAAKDGVDVVACRVMNDGVTEFHPRMTATSKIDNTLHHQGTFYRRAAHPGYDMSYRICGDFDMNQRLLRAGAKVRMSDAVVAHHANDGLSARPEARKEILRSVKSNYGWPYMLLARLRFLLAPLYLRLKYGSAKTR